MQSAIKKSEKTIPSSTHLETLQQHHTSSSNLHEKNERGETVLHLAAARGDLPAVEWLLSLKDPELGLESTTTSGETPFFIAVKHGQLEVARFLKNQGANVSARDAEGDGVNSLALSSNNFLDQWFERTYPDRPLPKIQVNPFSPFDMMQIVSPYDSPEFQVWADVLDLNFINRMIRSRQLMTGGGRSILSPAPGEALTCRVIMQEIYLLTVMGHFAELKPVPYTNGRLNVNVFSDQELLTHYPRYNQIFDMRLILWLHVIGIDFSKKDHQGRTFVEYDCIRGPWRESEQSRIVETLRNCPDFFSSLAIRYAFFGDLEKLKACSQEELALCSSTGATPLMVAAANGQIHVIEYLIQKGDDGLAFNYLGWLPAHAAIISGHLESLESLEKSGIQVSFSNDFIYPPLLLAAFLGVDSVLPFLLSHGSHISEVDEHQNSALLLATHGGRLSTVAWLLKNGSSINECNDQQVIPLMLAAANRNYDLFDFLFHKTGASLRGRVYEKNRYYFDQHRKDFSLLFRFGNIVGYVPQSDLLLSQNFLQGYWWAVQAVGEMSYKKTGFSILLDIFFMKPGYAYMSYFLHRHRDILSKLRAYARQFPEEFVSALNAILEDKSEFKKDIWILLSFLNVCRHPAYQQFLKQDVLELSGVSNHLFENTLKKDFFYVLQQGCSRQLVFKDIYLSPNLFDEFDGADSLRNMTSVSFVQCGLTRSHIEKFSKSFLRHLPNLSELDFSNNSLSESTLIILTDHLLGWPKIQRINLDGNRINHNAPGFIQTSFFYMPSTSSIHSCWASKEMITKNNWLLHLVYFKKGSALLLEGLSESGDHLHFGYALRIDSEKKKTWISHINAQELTVRETRFFAISKETADQVIHSLEDKMRQLNVEKEVELEQTTKGPRNQLSNLFKPASKEKISNIIRDFWLENLRISFSETTLEKFSEIVNSIHQTKTEDVSWKKLEAPPSSWNRPFRRS